MSFRERFISGTDRGSAFWSENSSSQFCYDGTHTPQATMPPVSLTFLSDASLAAAYAIFAGSYLVFALGKFPGFKIDRPAAAIIGAVAMVAFRIVPARGALALIDFPAIVLLFSMMVIVGSLHLCGFFEWTADLVWRHLRPDWFLPAVIFTTGILSAFLVNDIVCLVMVPLVMNLTRRLQLPALPYLLGVATASNIGSVATITGNPQNMLIGSYSGIQYREFLLHLGPVAVAGMFFDWLVLWWLFRREISGSTPNNVLRSIQTSQNESDFLLARHRRWLRHSVRPRC